MWRMTAFAIPTVQADSDIRSEEPHGNERLLSFLSKYRVDVAVSGFFLLLGYGLKLFGNTFSIDTQSMISVPDALYGSWYELGRYGLILLKKVTGLYWYNNVLSSFLTVVCFGAAALAWSYLLHAVAPEKNRSRPAFFIIPLVCSPVLAEQLGFLLQGPEITLSMMFVALSLLCVFRGSSHSGAKRAACYITALVLAFVAFSVYLAMVTLFIAGTAFIYVVRFTGNERRSKQRGVWVALCVVCFACAYALYAAINRIVMSVLGIEPSSYTSDQSRWGKDSVGDIAQAVLLHAKDMYTGSGIFYTLIASVTFVLFLVVLIVRIGRHEIGVISLLIGVAICVSPMLMSVILGSTPSVRTELSYAFAFAFAVFYIAGYVSSLIPAGLIVSWVCVAAIGLNQGFIVNRIFYTEAVTYGQDVQLSYEIKTRIDDLGYGETPELPVVFVGSHVPQRNNDCYDSSQLALVGRSLYEITFSTAHGTWVKNQFLNAQGVKYEYPSSAQMDKANAIVQSMPHWPAKGSVAVHDGLIIVNF